jgi:hypothetical protein
VVGALAVSTVAQLQQGLLGLFVSWIRSFIILALIGRQVLSLLENLSLASASRRSSSTAPRSSSL